VSAVELDRARCGGRNFIRPGDPISVAGVRAGKRRYPGKVRRILQGPAGVVVEYVVTRPHPRAGSIRCASIVDVRRVARARSDATT